MNEHQPAHAVVQSQTSPPARSRAEAKIVVQYSEDEPYDRTVSPALMEIRINETFTGDIDGQSMVRALQVLRDDQSASFVSMQRVRGKLGGRQGTFVLQDSEVVEQGKITAAWFVVPGSGTGDLSGLRGEGGFEAEFTEGSTIGSNDVAGHGLPVVRNRPKDVAEDVIPTFARGGIGTILAQ